MIEKLIGPLVNNGITRLSTGGPTATDELRRTELPNGQGQAYTSSFIGSWETVNDVPPADTYLVERTEDGWAPVTNLEGPIDRFTLADDYALWQDKTVKNSRLATLFGKPDIKRESDGIIQEDEIIGLSYGDENGRGNKIIGAEIIQADSPGQFSFRETIQNSSDNVLARTLHLGSSSDRYNKGKLQDPGNWVIR